MKEKKKLLSSVPSLFSARVHEYREFFKTDIFVMLDEVLPGIFLVDSVVECVYVRVGDASAKDVCNKIIVLKWGRAREARFASWGERSRQLRA